MTSIRTDVSRTGIVTTIGNGYLNGFNIYKCNKFLIKDQFTLLRHQFFHFVVLQQIHSLFQGEFSTECGPGLPLSIYSAPRSLSSASSYFFVCLFVGRPWQATDVLQPAGLLYRPLCTFQLWPPDAPAPTDAFRTLAAEVGTYGRRIRTDKFCLNADFHSTFGDLLPAANLRYGAHGFTSLPKEDVLRIFPPLIIRRLRLGMNPWTWVPQ
jgi:hypothetical protein